jgi:membrane peptidoglycan carboxypeptidase
MLERVSPASAHRISAPSQELGPALWSTAELSARLRGLLPLSWPPLPTLQAGAFTVRTSIDTGLQADLEQFLKSRRPRYAAVAAVRASTGEVLCLASHAYRKPWKERNLALHAGFPAASVFKIVTAAGALAEGRLGRHDRLHFIGSRTAAPGAWNMRTTISRKAHWATLEEAFAWSINPVFGKLGLFDLGPAGVRQWAEALGWNRPLTAQIEVEPSELALTEEPYSAAEVGSGYSYKTTLSPLHGAALAAAVVNGGVFIEPGLVHSVRDAGGGLRYRRPALDGRRVLAPQVAAELAEMMKATVEFGTASYAFGFRDGVLGRLVIGGKTGTLTGEDPPGRCMWLVGWAVDPGSGEALGFAALTLHAGRRSGTDAKELTRRLLSRYFGTLQVDAPDSEEAGVRSRRSQPLASLAQPAAAGGQDRPVRPTQGSRS